MKRIIITLAYLLIIVLVNGQSPQTLSHQIVIRNADNELVSNHQVGIKISIIQNSTSGIVVYQENYYPNPQTNANGLVTVEIGGGFAISGSFETIDWANGPYYIKTETDLNGGTDYTITETSQILSVPYALYAAKATQAKSLPPGNAPGEMLYWNGTSWTFVAPGHDGQNLLFTGGVPTWAFFECGMSKISDFDGNLYNTVKIGNQCWMRENLKTTHYADGTSLVDGTQNAILNDTITKYWFNFGQDLEISYKETYGLLYSWKAAMNGALSSNLNPSGVQGVCPFGWHLPSEGEWVQLINYLGGTWYAGEKLKESGSEHWTLSNNATNESRFTALGSGYFHYLLKYQNLLLYGYWWTSTKDLWEAWGINMKSSNSMAGKTNYNKASALSVRCIKN